MKKAMTYMIVGALAYGAVDMYMNKRCAIEKQLRKMKRTGMDAYNKVKSML